MKVVEQIGEHEKHISMGGTVDDSIDIISSNTEYTFEYTILLTKDSDYDDQNKFLNTKIIVQAIQYRNNKNLSWEGIEEISL